MIGVTRAIILRDKHLLAAQRPESMSLALKWELPGGKTEPGESFADCLIRETYEELRLDIVGGDALPVFERAFRDKVYCIRPYLCTVLGGEMQVMEHKQAIWQPLDRIFELDWGPAEVRVLEHWMQPAAVSASKNTSKLRIA